MSGPTYERATAATPDHAAHVPAADHAEQTELTARPYSREARDKIDAILAGTSPEIAQLPELFAVLDDATRAAFRQGRLPDLRARVGGDLLLDIAPVLGLDPATAVSSALHATRPPSAPALRRYLGPLDPAELATIQGTPFADMKALLDAPLLIALPQVAQHLSDFENHLGYLDWLVKTAPAGVVAELAASSGSEAMARTFNEGHLWSWVSALSPANAGVLVDTLAQHCTDDAARARMNALLGERARMNIDTQLVPYRHAHAGDIDQALADRPTVQSLMEALGRHGMPDDATGERLLTELGRLHATADDIMALSAAVNFDRKHGLRLLLASSGVTAQHITAYLAKGYDAIALMSDDTLRNGVRKAATQLQFQDLLAGSSVDSASGAILANDALARWFVAEAGPRDLLALIAQDPAKVATAIRFVVARYPDWSWVHQLTSPSSPDQERQVRMLALNCPDARARQYLRSTLLGDVDPEDIRSPIVKGSEPTDPRTQGSERMRMVDAMGPGGTREEVMARLADITDVDRARLGQSAQVAAAFGSTVGIELYPRAAYLLDLTFGHAIFGSPGPSTGTVAYLSTRPQAEQTSALGDPDLIQRAAGNVHKDLLHVFPSLCQPAALAAALARAPELLHHLLAGSNPDQLLALLATDAVRPHAQRLLTEHPEWIKLLPRYRDLSRRGQAGLDRTAQGTPKDSEDITLHDVHDKQIEPDPEPRDEAKRLHKAEDKPSLAAAIHSLVKSHGSAASMLALLDERRREVPELMSSRLEWDPTVRHVAELVDLPPTVALPWIAPDQLIAMPNALHWWMAYRDKTHLLHALAGNEFARRMVAVQLDTSPGTRNWLSDLPVGAALTDVEERALDQLRPLVHDAAVLAELFRVRFSVPVPKAYDARHINELYAIVSRLPSAHLQQHRIHAITNPDMKGAAAGLWSQHQVQIDERVHPGDQKDTFHPESMQGWYTAAQLKSLYGFEESSLEGRVQSGELEQKHDATATMFRVKAQSFDLFTQVVLHEVGHAVDAMLGERTPPVYDFAGWREFSDADFDKWAGEMGGWDAIEARDKKAIQQAWADASRANTSVDKLVDETHPARAARYAKTGIVATARAGKKFDHTERVEHNGRVFVVRAPNLLYSLDAKAAHSAPSVYSLFAPPEYFAESYVEYYRAVDGKPGSAARKGGSLPTTVKGWFDKNVDTLRYDPTRFLYGTSDDGTIKTDTEPGEPAHSKH